MDLDSVIEGRTDHFTLEWSEYQSHLMSSFVELRNEKTFIDLTISCEGKKLSAHQMLLSASSPYFRNLLQDNPCPHPIIVLRQTNYEDLVAILHFIYHGTVTVHQSRVKSFVKTAKTLQISGLCSPDDLGGTMGITSGGEDLEDNLDVDESGVPLTEPAKPKIRTMSASLPGSVEGTPAAPPKKRHLAFASSAAMKKKKKPKIEQLDLSLNTDDFGRSEQEEGDPWEDFDNTATGEISDLNSEETSVEVIVETTEEIQESVKFKRPFVQRFRLAWLDEPDFKDWIMPYPKNDQKAFCRVCDQIICGRYSSLKSHTQAKNHIKFMTKLYMNDNPNEDF